VEQIVLHSQASQKCVTTVCDLLAPQDRAEILNVFDNLWSEGNAYGNATVHK
jgi:hypothetical protein